MITKCSLCDTFRDADEVSDCEDCYKPMCFECEAEHDHGTSNVIEDTEEDIEPFDVSYFWRE